MQLRPAPSRRRLDRVTINLASMIDVSFLLLFYFMVATMMGDRENRLSAGLQTQRESATGSASDFQPQIVEVAMVDGAPAYRLGSRVFRDTRNLVEALKALNKSTGLFVKVNDGPSVGFVVAAFQAGEDAGFEKVTYVAPAN